MLVQKTPNMAAARRTHILSAHQKPIPIAPAAPANIVRPPREIENDRTGVKPRRSGESAVSEENSGPARASFQIEK